MSQSFKQELTACFGQPVAENPTQAMIEAAYRHHGLPWRYLTIEVAPQDLEAAVRGARAMGFVGFNCTLPHKVAVIPYLDGLGQSAKLIGAVNCVVRRDGLLVGENTDGKGFVESLKSLCQPWGKRVAILGAGGAARAIAVELALEGCSSILVVNRSEARGEELACDLAKLQVRVDFQAWVSDFRLPADVAILVQATSIGLYPDVAARVPIDMTSLRPGLIVADVIPNPPQTLLLREAKARGCLVLDGLGMLVNQGVRGIAYWTGITPDASVMRQALEDVFDGMS